MDRESLANSSSTNSSVTQISMMEGQLQYQRPSVVVVVNDPIFSLPAEDSDSIRIVPHPSPPVDRRHCQRPEITAHLIPLPLEFPQSDRNQQQRAGAVRSVRRQRSNISDTWHTTFHVKNYHRFFIGHSLVATFILFVLYLMYLLAISRVQIYFSFVFQFLSNQLRSCAQEVAFKPSMSLIIYVRSILRNQRSIEPINFLSAIGFTGAFVLINVGIWCWRRRLSEIIISNRLHLRSSTAAQDLAMQDIERGAAAAGETVNRNHQMIALEPCHHELVAKFSQYRCYQALTVKYQSLASILMSADINEEQQQSIAARMEEISTLVQSYRSQIQHGSIGSHRMPGYKLSQHVVVFQLPHQSRQRIAIGWRCDDFSQ